MSAKLFEFTGNPRPRVTQPAPAVVLILPVMRRGDRQKENDVVDLRYLASITEFDDWGPSLMCRCSLVDYNAAVREIMGDDNG